MNKIEAQVLHMFCLNKMQFDRDWKKIDAQKMLKWR